jgi:hypothetical protein
VAGRKDRVCGVATQVCGVTQPDVSLGARRPARMQQGQGLARQETVVDEEGLFDREARVATLQPAGATVLNALREDQILGACGGPHRVGWTKSRRAMARGRLVALKRLRAIVYRRSCRRLGASRGLTSFVGCLDVRQCFRIDRRCLRVTGNRLRIQVKIAE